MQAPINHGHGADQYIICMMPLQPGPILISNKLKLYAILHYYYSTCTHAHVQKTVLCTGKIGDDTTQTHRRVNLILWGKLEETVHSM